MELVLPILLGFPSLVLCFVLFVLEFRNGLRYGQGTTDVGCMPGPCGCSILLLGSVLGASLLPLGLVPKPMLALVPAALWLIHAANWRLGRAFGSSRDASLRQSRSDDIDARVQALERLAERPDSPSDKHVRQALLDGLSAEDWRVFQPAALGAHRAGATPVVLAALRRRLLDEETAGHDRQVLAELGPPAAALLLDLLDRGEGGTAARSTALEVLAALGDRRVLPHLLRGLADDALRPAAATAAGLCPDASLVDPLLAALKDSDPRVVAGAAKSLVALDRSGLLKAFEPISEKAAPDSVQPEIVEALALLADPRAVPLFVPLLRHPNASVRLAAWRSLNSREWTPGSDEDRAFHAMAGSRWKDLLRWPESAVPPLLLAAKDSGSGEDVAATIEKLLRASASKLSREDLDRLSVLQGVEQAQFKDMGYHDPVNCDTVNRLAREELARRG